MPGKLARPSFVQLTRKTILAEKEPQDDARSVLAEMYELLEEYAPGWYSQQLRKRAKKVLQGDNK